MAERLGKYKRMMILESTFATLLRSGCGELQYTFLIGGDRRDSVADQKRRDNLMIMPFVLAHDDVVLLSCCQAFLECVQASVGDAGTWSVSCILGLISCILALVLPPLYWDLDCRR